MEEYGKKQSVGGFKVLQYTVKKAKDGEKLKLLLEADVENVKAGEYDVGDVLKALLTHQTSEVDVALSVFIEESE